MSEVLLSFAGLLRGLRTEAGLTQEELALAAGLTTRAISYLERGEVTAPRRETVRLLADALQLTGEPRALFETAARGRVTRANGAAAMRTLPRDVASFTGRHREMAVLAAAAARGDAGASIHAIGGMAGVGKTAFTVHAAHRLASRFPGGQIFLPLHGHTPGQHPAEPANALASLLTTIGIPASQIPAGLQARMALWRERTAGRRLLLILDDAIGSDQVAPLLPGANGSMVLITSRRRLSALADASSITLDTLPPDQAAELLARLSGRPGLRPEDLAVGELIRLCGFLPLAIGMVARQLRHHKAWTASGRATELAAAADRLEVLTTENLSVAAAFDLSYAGLNSDQQRLFRRLGLHPGPDIDGYAAAALDEVSLATARQGLEDLYDRYLVTEPMPGRYRLHDLIREHARALADRLDSGEDRDAAMQRLLDYYQHAAARADALIARMTWDAHGAACGPAAGAVPALGDAEQALAWVRAERASLVSCLDHATCTAQYARVIALTAGLGTLIRVDGPWPEAITRHTIAVQAARYLGDRRSEAGALTALGDVRRLTGDHPGSARDLREALAVFRDIGDRRGQADALTNLGKARQHDYPAAVQDLREALSIYRDIGDRHGQADALTCLGRVCVMTGDFRAAAVNLQEGLVIQRDIGDRHGQAESLLDLGRVRGMTGDRRAAVRDLTEAVGIARDIGYSRGLAGALVFLGGVRWRSGDYRAAARDLEEAIGISREIGYRVGVANAALHLGTVGRLTGDWQVAFQHLQEALGIYRDIGSLGGEVTALNEAGALNRDRGDLGEARSYHQRALDLARAIDSSWDEAQALAGLSRCALADGRIAEGVAGLRQALMIFQRIGSAEATGVSAELDALSGPGQAHSML